jgi:hypothetical protein
MHFLTTVFTSYYAEILSRTWPRSFQRSALIPKPKDRTQSQCTFKFSVSPHFSINMYVNLLYNFDRIEKAMTDIHFSANMNRTPKQQVFIKNLVDLIPLSNFTA